MKISVPSSALDELEVVEAADLSVSAEGLVEWVNQTVERFLPEAEPESGRVSLTLSVRSLRHYQTLGCVDAPVREGREVRYGFRHFLQALLLRKLLWEKVPADTIVQLLQDKTTQEYKKLLLEGIEIQAIPADGPAAILIGQADTWLRIPLAHGLEVHLSPDRLSFKKADIPALVQAFEKALRAHG